MPCGRFGGGGGGGHVPLLPPLGSGTDSVFYAVTNTSNQGQKPGLSFHHSLNFVNVDFKQFKI